MKTGWPTIDSSFSELWDHPGIREDLVALLGVLDAQATTVTNAIDGLEHVPIRLHGKYTRAEVLAAFDLMPVEAPYAHQTGVAWSEAHQADLLFVTLKKSERDFSPTTMYRDHALGPRLFHWESQGTTALSSKMGQRYVHHVQRGSRVLLFVREKKDEPFVSLGMATYERHQGERPMAIEWRLAAAIPEWFLRKAVVVS